MLRTESADRERLCRLSKEGDRQARDDLWRSLRPMVSGFLGKRVRRPDHAEDLVQGTLTRADAALGSFRGDCPVSQWVLRIAVNELRRYYERGLRSIDDPLPDEDLQRSDEGPGPYNRVEDRQFVERILDAAKRACSNPEFTVLMLLYRGESLAEVGEMLGLDDATVRSHHRRGRAKLIAELITHEPDLVGGQDAINEAVRRCEGSGGLSVEEREAIDQRSGKAEILRSACLKIAKYLPSAVGSVLLGGLR
ncbi:MAG TPA: sigma-70 family RNA polymerase sigma factor [Fimbriimonadaceae bacterium]|nr:sigma-70 family RNA polymerase sigma factor [Fimbriimonadaceae bacterium]HRJ97563.1 sigma-70 family RNA polymerase sigma factor [Fimbriimonadaceae bacterium]